MGKGALQETAQALQLGGARRPEARGHHEAVERRVRAGRRRHDHGHRGEGRCSRGGGERRARSGGRTAREVVEREAQRLRRGWVGRDSGASWSAQRVAHEGQCARSQLLDRGRRGGIGGRGRKLSKDGGRSYGRSCSDFGRMSCGGVTAQRRGHGRFGNLALRARHGEARCGQGGGGSGGDSGGGGPRLRYPRDGSSCTVIIGAPCSAATTPLLRQTGEHLPAAPQSVGEGARRRVERGAGWPSACLIFRRCPTAGHGQAQQQRAAHHDEQQQRQAGRKRQSPPMRLGRGDAARGGCGSGEMRSD